MSRRKHDAAARGNRVARLHDGSIDGVRRVDGARPHDSELDDAELDDAAFDDAGFDDAELHGAIDDGRDSDDAPSDSPATASDPRTSVDDLWRMAEQPHLRAWIVANTSAPADLINEIARVGGPGVHRALAILRESLAAPGSATEE